MFVGNLEPTRHTHSVQLNDGRKMILSGEEREKRKEEGTGYEYKRDVVQRIIWGSG